MDNFSVLILFTIFSFFSAFLPLLIKWILPLVASRSKAEAGLIAELRDIKTQLASMSMVDEFAKYAKLQRRVIKVQEHLNEKANIRMASTLKTKIALTYFTQFVMAIILLFMIWSYRYEPVLYLPEGWLYPVEGLLSWPTGESGAISVTAWLLISGTSLRAVAAMLG